jgi:hypothetical protein
MRCDSSIYNILYLSASSATSSRREVLQSAPDEEEEGAEEEEEEEPGGVRGRDVVEGIGEVEGGGSRETSK